MAEIKIRVPNHVPPHVLRKRIEEVVEEEELKWALFERSREEVALTEEDLEILERIREETWKERKKKYGL